MSTKMWDVIVQDGKVLPRIQRILHDGADTSQIFEIATHSDEPEDLAWYREMLQNAMSSVAKRGTESK